MARVINTRSGNKPKELAKLWEMAPSDINVEHAQNVRHTPVPYDKILELAESLYTDGQLQPIGVRVLPDKSFGVVFGFTRHTAATMVVDGVTLPSGEVICNPDFKLQVILVDSNEINDEKATVKAFRENMARKDLTPMDLAYGALRMKELYGYDQRKIGVIYGKHETQISRYLDLLSLPQHLQDLVASGEITMFYAMRRIGVVRDVSKKGGDGEAIAAKIDEVVERVKGVNGYSVPVWNSAEKEVFDAIKREEKDKQTQQEEPPKLRVVETPEAAATETQEEDIEAHGTVEDDLTLYNPDGTYANQEPEAEPTEDIEDDTTEPEPDASVVAGIYHQITLAELKANIDLVYEYEECVRPVLDVFKAHIRGEIAVNEFMERLVELCCETMIDE
jgi:ParB-like chromosome segregation protein Spo0J